MFFAPTGSPRIFTAPLPDNFSGKMPFKCSSKVDLPEPFGPSSATHSPGAMRKLTPRNASVPS